MHDSLIYDTSDYNRYFFITEVNPKPEIPRYKYILENICCRFLIEDEKITYTPKIGIKELKAYIETIISNIPDGVLLFNPELKINYANDRFKELFGIKGDSPDEKMHELFDPVIYEKINSFVQSGNDKTSFEWIIAGNAEKHFINIKLKQVSNEFILMTVTEIKDLLAGKELEACYYIIRGHSEREIAKILYRSRTTINSNKVRAKEKLRRNGYLLLSEKLK